MKISVTVITKNEEKNILECLNSVKWADEIVVVDSESTDKTLEIARNFTEKVVKRKWEGYADQKAFALELTKNEWVLSLDADERCTKQLEEEIKKLNPEDISGFFIKRDNFFLGKKINGCGWGDDNQLRLFKKSNVKLTDRKVHEGFVVDGKTAKLKSSMLHYSYHNLHDAMIKINNYSTLEAEEKYKKKRVRGASIFFKPFIGFVQHFIFRKGYMDGVYGLIVSLMHAITKWQVQMKIWELQNSKAKIDEAE